MRVTIPARPHHPEQVYRVHIDHKHYDPCLIIEGKYKELQVTDLVRCVIKRNDDAIGIGERYCSVRDTFDLHRGRREALALALREGGFTMAERKMFWDEFVKSLPRKSQVQSLLARIANLEEIIDYLRTR